MDSRLKNKHADFMDGALNNSKMEALCFMQYGSAMYAPQAWSYLSDTIIVPLIRWALLGSIRLADYAIRALIVSSYWTFTRAYHRKYQDILDAVHSLRRMARGDIEAMALLISRVRSVIVDAKSLRGEAD